MDRETYRALEAIRRDLYRERCDRLEEAEKFRKEIASLKRRLRLAEGAEDVRDEREAAA